MANDFSTIQGAAGVIAKLAAQTLRDNLVFCSSIDQADESDFDGKNGYSAGDTIYVNVPARYIPQETFDITSSIRDTVETRQPLPLDIIKTVGVEAGTLEYATEIQVKNYFKRVIKPAVESIAHHVEQKMLEKATQSVYNSVGTAGTNQFSLLDVGSGKVKMDEAYAPLNDRTFLLNSASNLLGTDARKGLYQDSTGIAEQYRDGQIGRTEGFNWYTNELIYSHTNGNDVTGVTKDGNSTEADSTLAVTGLTATTGTVKKGTVFTIAGINKVSPITKDDTGVLQQFVVTADATADGNGDAVLSISPTLYAGSDGLQNITALPSNSDALTFVGAASTTYKQPLQYHKSAFRMVSVPLIMPTAGSVDYAAQETVDGITVAIVQDWEQLQRRKITRIDFLGGIASVRPEWACRVTT